MSYVLLALFIFVFLPTMLAAFAAGWGVGRSSGLREGEEKLNRYIAKQSNNRR